MGIGNTAIPQLIWCRHNKTTVQCIGSNNIWLVAIAPFDRIIPIPCYTASVVKHGHVRTIYLPPVNPDEGCGNQGGRRFPA